MEEQDKPDLPKEIFVEWGDFEKLEDSFLLAHQRPSEAAATEESKVVALYKFDRMVKVINKTVVDG